MQTEYPEDELVIRAGLDDLMREAESEWFSNERHSHTIFVEDGFYPFYTHQKKKILFLGRESYGDYPYYVSNNRVNLNDIYYSEYRSNTLFKDALGDGCEFRNSLFSNRRPRLYHANILAIAYAIINNRWDFEDFDIVDIASSFASSEGISFAALNLSKISNCTGNTSCISNKEVIKEYTAFDRGWGILNKEIALLNPDIIISANLNDLCRPLHENLFSVLGTTTHLDSDKKIRKTYPCELIKETLFLPSKEIPIYDIFHFSARKRCICESHAALEKIFHYHFI